MGLGYCGVVGYHCCISNSLWLTLLQVKMAAWVMVGKRMNCSRSQWRCEGSAMLLYKKCNFCKGHIASEPCRQASIYPTVLSTVLTALTSHV